MQHRSLKLSLLDALFFSLMVGIGENYLTAFALSLRMPEYLAGLFSTVPLLLGAFLQLLVPLVIHQFRSLKAWVVGAALIQASIFLPFIYFNFYNPESFIYIFILAGIYWAAGFALTPAWNLWMNQILPVEISSEFFSKRHRIIQVGILIGLIWGGHLLHSYILGEDIFWVLFLIAFSSRCLSSICLSKQHHSKAFSEKYKISDLVSVLKIPSYRTFFGFLFLFYIAISISSPFVTPYFLGKLNLNYRDYMWALASLLIAKILTLPLAAKLIKRFDVKKLFLFGALGMSPLPALWSLSQNYFFILFLQAASGMFWGFFEVSLSVIFFNQIAPEKKIVTLTTFNFFNSVAIAIGALVGAYLLKGMDQSFKGYYAIFIFGAILRTVIVISYGTMMKSRKELLGNS